MLALLRRKILGSPEAKSAPKLTPFEREALDALIRIEARLSGIEQATREVSARVRDNRCNAH